jgi:DNA transformation protein
MSSGERLEELPNLDAGLVGRLRAVGIETPDELREVGAIGAYLACRDDDEDWDQLEPLFWLEGAIRGVAADEISELDRDAMKADVQTALSLGEF